MARPRYLERTAIPATKRQRCRRVLLREDERGEFITKQRCFAATWLIDLTAHLGQHARDLVSVLAHRVGQHHPDLLGVGASGPQHHPHVGLFEIVRRHCARGDQPLSPRQQFRQARIGAAAGDDVGLGHGQNTKSPEPGGTSLSTADTCCCGLNTAKS